MRLDLRDFLAAFRVPEAERPVLAVREDLLAVGREPAEAPSGVAFQFSHLLARRHVPEAQGLVLPAGNRPLAVPRQIDTEDIPLVALPLRQLLAAADVPAAQRSVQARGQDVLPVRGEGGVLSP